MANAIIAKKIKTSKEFIPVSIKKMGSIQTEAVDARIIYEELEVKKDFSDWVKNQIKRLGLLEGEDYIKLPFQGEAQKGNVIKIDYFFTIDSVKHIGMASLLKKGREIRDYFIRRDKMLAQVEKDAKKRQSDVAYQQARLEGKKLRLQETDTIKEFVEYAKKQGSTKAQMYYLAITKMENQALFYMVEGMPKPNNIREVLDTFQLFQISVADRLVSDTIKRCMARNMHYKDIYVECSDKIKQLANTIGKTPIPVQQFDLLTA